MTTPLTPAEHRAQAEASLALLFRYAPSTDMYRNLALSAIAHVLAAVAEYLEPPQAQSVPGLPAGWRLETQQSGTGDRKWAYVLSAPGGNPHFSRYTWSASETALAAGLRAAREITIREQDGNHD